MVAGKVNGGMVRKTASRFPLQPKLKLLHSLRAKLRLGHFSRRTEEAYAHWVYRFVRHQGLRHPREMAEREVVAFLTHLAVDRKLAAATQAQALAALQFLYRHVMDRPLVGLGAVPKASAPVRLPVVLSEGEVQRILRELDGVPHLIGMLLYGSGMRLLECLTLRIKDVDLERGEIWIRRGKGAKDRVTMLPRAARGLLAEQLERARSLHQGDLAEGAGAVELPDALRRKYPSAPRQWRGSGFFRHAGDTWIARPENVAGTICTKA